MPSRKLPVPSTDEAAESPTEPPPPVRSEAEVAVRRAKAAWRPATIGPALPPLWFQTTASSMRL
jgi:hypothetical protein